jgi:hypothetical protein
MFINNNNNNTRYSYQFFHHDRLQNCHQVQNFHQLYHYIPLVVVDNHLLYFKKIIVSSDTYISGLFCQLLP